MISECAKDRRNPLTAGKAWTMSPSEPRRTTRNFGSAMRRLAHGLQEISGRVVFRIADNGYADPQPLGDGALRHGFSAVVCALGVDVRPQFAEQVFDVWLVENHD